MLYSYPYGTRNVVAASVVCGYRCLGRVPTGKYIFTMKVCSCLPELCRDPHLAHKARGLPLGDGRVWSMLWACLVPSTLGMPLSLSLVVQTAPGLLHLPTDLQIQ